MTALEAPAFLPRPAMAFVLMALAVLANMLPLLVYDIGGDILFHHVLLDCFGQQLWRGVLYPRWCPDADAGLGAPVFLFYFPLPYYAAGLLYPLKTLGVSTAQLYALGCFAAGMATLATAYLWLRQICAPLKAALGALVFLYLPYRMELLLFRSAYGELWGMAFLPLLFYAASRLAREGRGSGRVALATALLMLSHTPTAAIGLGMAAFYLLFARPKPWRAAGRYAAGVLQGLTLSAFFWGPALLYRPFITGEGVVAGKRSWTNDFIGFDHFYVHHQWQLLIVIFMMLLATIALFFYVSHLRRRIVDAQALRDFHAWGWIFSLSFFLFLPLSRPAWEAVPGLMQITFPWRMQSIIGMSAVFFFAAMTQYLPGFRRARTARADFLLLILLLQMLALFVVSAPAPEVAKFGDKMLHAQYVSQREYRTIWTPKSPTPLDDALAEFARPSPRVELLQGDAQVEIGRWERDDVRLRISARDDTALRLRLAFFPVWRMEASPPDVFMLPDPRTGRILLDMPPGEYEMRLSPSVFAFRGSWIKAVYGISAAGWLIFAGCVFLRRKKAV